MPYRKKRGYRKKPRKRKSRQSSGQGRVIVFKNPSPLPMKFKATLRYADPYIKIPAPSDTFLGTQVYSCNGIYDPYATGVGHQPSGFDQLMLMFDHFVVIGAKMIVTFVNNDTQDPMIVGIDIRDSTSGQFDSRVVIESGSAKYASISPRDSGQNQVTLNYKINPSRFLGRSKPLSDPQLKGSASGNPTEQCYFHVFGGNLDDQGTSGNEITANIVIEYQVVFIEPKQVGLS